MCYYITTDSKQLAMFGLPETNMHRVSRKYIYNGFEKPFIPTRGIENPGVIDSFQWGLIPGWVDEPEKWRANTLNAKAHELWDKPSYRAYWGNRCVVYATGFFEPHYENLSDPSNKNQSWYIKRRDGEMIMLGGIYNNYRGVNTVSIITVDASPLLAWVHNDGERAPFILEEETLDDWFDPKLTKDDMLGIMAPYDYDYKLLAYRVKDGVFSTKVNSNVPEVAVPIGASTDDDLKDDNGQLNLL